MNESYLAVLGLVLAVTGVVMLIAAATFLRRIKQMEVINAQDYTQNRELRKDLEASLTELRSGLAEVESIRTELNTQRQKLTERRVEIQIKARALDSMLRNGNTSAVRERFAELLELVDEEFD